MTSILFIEPKNTLSGGHLEINRLATLLSDAGYLVHRHYIFPNNCSLLSAFLLFPWFFALSYFRCLRNSPDLVICTHYSTLSHLFIFPSHCRICFLQDFEWLFPSDSIFLQSIFKWLMLSCYSSCRSLIFANKYLHSVFTQFPRLQSSLIRFFLYPVGSQVLPSNNSLQAYTERIYDLIFIIRKGRQKSFELYVQVINKLISSFPSFRVACIGHDTNKQFFVNSPNFVFYSYCSKSDLLSLFSSSKYYLLLSKHEGFGLPPLEAMSCGCVPILLANGGCTNYIPSSYPFLLPLSSTPHAILNMLSSSISMTSSEFHLFSEYCFSLFSNYNSQSLDLVESFIDDFSNFYPL